GSGTWRPARSYACYFAPNICSSLPLWLGRDLRPLAGMRAEPLPPQHVYHPSRCARGLRVVCRALGARRPLFRRSQFHGGFRTRKPVYLKKAKRLDSLLRERTARHRGYPFFKPNPRPRPKLPLQLNLNLRSRGSAKIAALAAIVAFAVVWGLSSSPKPVTTTASASNCGFS